jgi:hypothetical protein
MRVDPLRQAEALGLAVLIGIGAGLLYDLLRPPRWRLRAAAAFALDALYCLILGAALFVFAMSRGDGRLGLGALAAAWTGFLAYHWLLSPRLLPLFVKIFQYLGVVPAFLKKILKKVADFEK